MNYVLRYGFYAVGIVILAYLGTANPDHVQFSDLVRLIQSPEAWQATATLAVLLAAFDAVLGISSLVEAVIPRRQVPKGLEKASGLVPPGDNPV